MVRMRKGIVGFDAVSCHESNDLVKVRPFKYLEQPRQLWDKKKSPGGESETHVINVTVFRLWVCIAQFRVITVN